MQFRSFPPSPLLQDVVSYYWTLRSEDTDQAVQAYRLVPDGTLDWFFHTAKPWSLRVITTKHTVQCAKAHVFGQIEHPVDLTLPPGGLDVFAVRFKPWAARAFWGADMNCFTNAFTPLADLDVKGPKELAEQIAELDSTHERIVYVERFLNNKWSVTKKGEQLIAAFNSDLDTNGEVAFGTRRKQQLFRSEIGISPRLLARTLRFNKTIKKVEQGGCSSLTELAYDSGYYDQSHLIRDFQRFTGMSPKLFLKSIAPSGEVLNLRVPLRSETTYVQ